MTKTLKVAPGCLCLGVLVWAAVACTVPNENLPVEPSQGTNGAVDAAAPKPPSGDGPTVGQGGVAGSAVVQTMPNQGGSGSGGAAGGSTAQGGAAGQPPPAAGGQGGVAPPVDPLPPAPMPPAPQPPANPPVVTPPSPTSFDFEQDTHGWVDLDGMGSVVSRSTVRAFTGTSSLQVQLKVDKDDPIRHRYIGLPAELMPKLKAGTNVTYHVWIPASESKKITGVQGFVQAKDGSPAGWAGMTRNIAGFMKVDGFLDIVVGLPADFAVTNLNRMGVQIFASAEGGEATIYVDSVTFEVRAETP